MSEHEREGLRAIVDAMQREIDTLRAQLAEARATLQAIMDNCGCGDGLGECANCERAQDALDKLDAAPPDEDARAEDTMSKNEQHAKRIERTILESAFLSGGLSDETLDAVRAGAAALREIDTPRAQLAEQAALHNGYLVQANHVGRAQAIAEGKAQITEWITAERNDDSVGWEMSYQRILAKLDALAPAPECRGGILRCLVHGRDQFFLRLAGSVEITQGFVQCLADVVGVGELLPRRRAHTACRLLSGCLPSTG